VKIWNNERIIVKIVVVLLGLMLSAAAYALTQAQPTPPVLIYNQDCNGGIIPSNLPAVTTVVASGVGSVYTTVYTQGSVTWTQTVDTSVSNTTKISCTAHN